MLTYVFATLFALTLTGYIIGYRRAYRLAGGKNYALHSRPSYHGAFIAVWVIIPSFLLVLLWLLFQESVIDTLLVRSLPPEKTADLSQARIALLLSEVKQLSKGMVFGQPDAVLLEAAARYKRWHGIAQWAMFASVLAFALTALSITRLRISSAFRARPAVERVLNGIMLTCSGIAVLTTLGIVVSLLFESLRFFERVSPLEFFLGLNWEPQIAIRADQVAGSGAFGAIPVFTGTLQIAAIALLVAVPVGLLSAVYLTQYASPRLRSMIKPVLEILAGIPSIVYGFFAVLVVAPALRETAANLGLAMAPNSAIVAGGVMGIMIIPFVSSLSDDAINAVPGAMRDGSFALGATKGETAVRVMLPAALPGIMGGILLAASRAIGETMIVVMAAGLIANLTLNPFEAVTTVTVQIVSLLIGDTEFDNPKTLAAFALGLVLFVVTLILNIIALRIVQKYREKYD